MKVCGKGYSHLIRIGPDGGIGRMKRRVVLLVSAGVGILLVAAFGVLIGVAGSHLASSVSVARGDVSAKGPADFSLMAEAWDALERHYVDKASLQPKKLIYGAVSGMMDALGDTGHSAFLTPKMVAEERDFRKNKFEGIGAEIQAKSGHVVIVAPLDNSPALRAGLRPGDIILKVSGENVSGLALSEAVERIRGAPGTSVTLTIMTPATGRTQDITLVRQAIRINNVTWLRIPGTTIVHVRIASFSQDAAAHLREALESIRTERFSGIVLDLRNNPGGILDEVVRATGQFLTGGNVLLVKDADGQITPVPVVRGGLLPNLPMVVLVNNGTASAAEIMAGALKDARRAVLVGETTFGTGTVLKQFGLSDGSALLIAIEEWLTPSGQTIWHKGIAPDVIVSLPPDVMPTIPSAERGMTPEELRASGDAQLSRAQQMLSGSPDVKK